ncbi:immunoglobulin-binding protein 1-like [Liolophura sinensis]|uniref:immunoglobulin-binding protein 1-like n=1 Tax=Liolophura sinensis TaxID=3198878 RepID=UPI003158A2FC
MAEGTHEHDVNLKDIFDDIFDYHKSIEDSSEPTNSTGVQSKVKNAIGLCQRAIFMVNKLRLFSDNEDIEEVSTNEIRYMLLSAYLGYFTLKNTSEDRINVVKLGEHYIKDFLHLCQSYSVCQRLIPNLEESEDPAQGDNSAKPSSRPPDLNAMKREREEKIRRYKEKQATTTRLKELSEAVKQSHVDEEVKREYYMTLLTQWVHTSVEELTSIKDELPILEHMAKLKIGEASAKKEVDKPLKQPFRPFILTKNNMQKEVFGLGYPAVPTMTIEEFYQKKVDDGTFQLHSESLQDWAMNPEKTAAAVEEEEVEKEEKIERDDPVTIIRERNWDEWKDDHRRGWGNRQNMG